MKKEIKLKIKKELTPRYMICEDCAACPAIFETNRNTYVIIGKRLNAKKLEISERVAKDEVLVEIPKKLINKRKR